MLVPGPRPSENDQLAKQQAGARQTFHSEYQGSFASQVGYEKWQLKLTVLDLKVIVRCLIQ